MRKIIYIALFLYNISQIDAVTLTAICNGLNGIRIDYNGKNFDISEDKIINSSPTIVFNTSKKTVTYVIKDAMERALSIEGAVLQLTKEHLSFVGIMDGAPALFTLYYPEGILYVTEHARMVPFLSPTEPPKAKLFYSKCQIDIGE
jgi:hypothetical protein